MSDHIKKSHNKTLLMYHLVFPSKYRRKIFTKEVEKSLVEISEEISGGYEVHFVEIGADEDHVHFLIQSVPMLSVTRLVTMVKSIIARGIYRKHKEVKQKLWGGHIWTSGYYANTVGQYANEKVIKEYVQNQGKKYDQIYRGQLKLFEGLV